MGWMRTVLREILGLFVEDESFALAVLAWLVVAGLGLPRLGVPAGWLGVVLFAGLAAILIQSATRQSGRSSR